MHKKQFQQHPLWETLDQVQRIIDGIADDDGVDAAEREWIARLRELHSFSFSVRPLGVHYSGRFSPPLLEAVRVPWEQALSYLQQRSNGVAYRSSTQQAVEYAESTLSPLGVLYRPPTPAAQQAEIRSVYADLLDGQERDLAALQERRQALRDQLMKIGEDAKEEFEEIQTALAGISTTADETNNTIGDYESRLKDVVDAGNKRIGELSADNTKAYSDWQKEQTERFEQDFAPFTTAMRERLTAAQDALDELRTKETEYATLSAAAAAGTLAASFEKEARRSQRIGIGLYSAGFLLLAGAAVPLVFLLLPRAAPQSVDVLWTSFFVRLSIGVLAASAATVAIRLGSRFISAGQQSKRTELELRAFGPFLSNVDKTIVDTARLEFVDRAFAPRNVPDTHHDDTIPVGAIAQIMAAAGKLLGR